MAGDETAGGFRRYVADRVRTSVDTLGHLVGGLGTALLSLAALIWLLALSVACLVGVGLVLMPTALRMVRAIADRERARLSRWGPEIIGPEPLPEGRRAALRDAGVRRELGWVATHGMFGVLVGALGITLPIYAVEDATFPLWWWAAPPETFATGGPGLPLWPVHTFGQALAVGLLGVGWLAVAVVLGPGLARWQAWPGRRLLAPAAGADLALRVVQLTSTRAAALDAHAAELRRIERSLHEGAQNRLVTVSVLLGAARRALARDPATAEEILGRAQDAAESALADLRTVVRGILPPVLDDRGLAGALGGLAGGCTVPCRIDVDVAVRCAASVEATAYFVVAEALTNVTKHSGATSVAVTVRRRGDRLVLRVDDDGHGGADEGHGSGLTGIRQRVEAHDGRLDLSSPAGGPTTMEVELPCGS
ncbi:sensor domain-containing protein [Actinoplanes sp. KI2]|uniref:sensor histidine kinase n=1 Tax=Actinoplanes sp. KI2 TaxID=2983315 RepID=UPI0021D59852|nr:sensor histidine kinase [Actinoplanes sp. KI2]MCU7728379.1 sensor domain-containing protein [Actinoplanes sp. KI2]